MERRKQAHRQKKYVFTTYSGGFVTVYFTSNVKVSSHSSTTRDLTRLLYHAWFPKPHTHISALTALALLKTTNKRYEIRNEMRYLFERNKNFKHFGQCTHMWLHWLVQISNFTKKRVKLMLVKINVTTLVHYCEKLM